MNLVVSAGFVNLIVLDQITNEIRVQTQTHYDFIEGSLSIDAYKTVKKDTEFLEDLKNGVGLHIASWERTSDDVF